MTWYYLLPQRPSLTASMYGFNGRSASQCTKVQYFVRLYTLFNRIISLRADILVVSAGRSADPVCQVSYRLL